MKNNKIFKAIAGIAFAAVMFLNINVMVGGSFDLSLDGLISGVSAEAEINPDCPNGCVAGKGGCFCFIKYPKLKEATHKK
jgi:hypothetical protein